VTLSLGRTVFCDIGLVSIPWPPSPGQGQGHRNRHGSIRHLWLPINVP